MNTYKLFSCSLQHGQLAHLSTDLRHKRVAVHYDRVVNTTIPEVEFNASAPSQQRLAVHLN